MTFDQWVDVASSIGTVVAAIIAAISIGVIRGQNKNQYRPRITISDTWHNVFLEDGSHSWNKKSGGKSFQPRVGLPLLNVGNGTATHLVVRWRYNLDDMIKSCNAALANVGRDAHFKMRDGWLEFRSSNSMLAMINGPTNNVEKIDYIAPVTAQPKGKEISVDFSLQSLSAMHVLAMGKTKEGINFSDTNYNIEILVNYLDSLGNKYEEIIPIRLSLGMWQGGSGADPAEALFRIERIV